MQDRPLGSTFDNAIATQKFGVGQPVRRKEDDTLVRGRGTYTDDLRVPGQAYAWIVRSSHAHGVIRGIDLAAARAMPGVLGAWTGADLAAAGYGTFGTGVPLKNRDGSPIHQTNRPALALDRVRFVGDPVAFVVAETLAQARDAAEAVGVDIDVLPAVTDAEAATMPGAPQLYDHIPHNVALDFHSGDTAAVDKAFAAAAHVARLGIANTRLAVVPMEPRSGLAVYDKANGHFTIHAPTQGVAGNRTMLAKNLNVPKDKVRLLTHNVGGSFGMKNINYPEYMCILHAARELDRPVKWTDERSTSFLSDSHGRAQDIVAELALAADGAFLAVRVSGYGNLGAYITGVAPVPLSINIAKNIASVYRTPLIEVAIKCVVTNTTLMGAYRGAGRPEANYFLERLIDLAADQMGIDRLALRRRNFVKPAQIPYAAANGMTYDSGDFQGVFNDALKLADHAGFAKRKRDSRKRGKLRGIAVGSYLEITAPPSVELGKIAFKPDGSVQLATGTLDYGQGHATPYAQVLCDRLGVPFDAVTLLQGDSDIVHTGNGTGGSRSITASGQAIVEAADLVIEKGKSAASYVLEAAPGDIEFSAGRFTITGTDRSISIMDLAQRLRAGGLPEGAPTSLDVDHTSSEVPSTFPNGCHVAEVEVDPDTGVVEIVGYSGVNDFGTVVNPMIVAGQVHGGVAQGIGQALMECVRYDDNGQPVTGSFMDYALPRAGDIPPITLGDHPAPATSNPLGTKGCGEAGCAGSLATIVNAVVDALSEYGVSHIDMPLTPERVWRAIQDAKAAKAATAAA
ncbi:xanthine dehydrogenase family protein molybdopterin-binding subunit [Bradyrhizobium sp. U87765 SZCCT0131]|uniref:xanthine dehydrogenase family protein molybdopterin-binding subunit n=1 Tax=unclassified Bradyrhizobium TaxID=2631580 RepID=UPI001BA843CE|nr:MULTISPECIES: xanthine dehydrogenase family protein molybdopterin-binding subunit [unclassified Bradyrhizobium]MBR1220621.1 xanthine dehydrogenase family protein molybdopterin-binding subunit [Bradyrhizobium sp. U87765 SZCCT0131]MBR1262925.1 xanthine dehydrogenase family protein molybdopterin-binding subunit [Bradyrhizobium sp. U87765 SZCCT0134]MBR1307193.1 xanthine dehydrogenase family protein molybdopterin-binding subunit [Bradyrhizobium sp. U87765 SZCCT0110]MBR1322920.1 xanthine dehydroge